MHHLDIPASRTLKAVFYQAIRSSGTESVIVAIRGDLEVNETKLRNALGALDVRLMSDDEVQAAGLVDGSASPVGLRDIAIVADDSIPGSANLVAGANKPDVHYRNVNLGRDWQADTVADIALARPGDACGRCGQPFESKRGIEMGHIFKLGTRYTGKMDAAFLDSDGQKQLAIMGCYGIGTSRLLQGVIEANHDDRGIIWPRNLAPFVVHLVGLGLDRPEIAEKVDALYTSLTDGGIEVLYDDRTDASAGVKFNDADLIGVPLRITLSPRSLEKDSIEVKLRAATDSELIPFAEFPEQLASLLES